MLSNTVRNRTIALITALVAGSVLTAGIVVGKLVHAEQLAENPFLVTGTVTAVHAETFTEAGPLYAYEEYTLYTGTVEYGDHGTETVLGRSPITVGEHVTRWVNSEGSLVAEEPGRNPVGTAVGLGALAALGTGTLTTILGFMAYEAITLRPYRAPRRRLGAT